MEKDTVTSSNVAFYKKAEVTETTEKQKILFTDLDATLLKNDKTVSEKNRAAIQKLLDAGHLFVIATGRPVKSSFEVAKSLGLTMPGCYMIAYNGAVVYDCAKESVLIERTLSMEHVKYLFQEAEKYGLHIQTYADEVVLTQSYDKELQYYVKQNGMSYRIAEDVFSVLEKEPCKTILISLDEKEKMIRFQEEHREWEEGKCNSFFSCEEYLEYCPLNTDKGSGIRALCDFLHIDITNAYAVGDERNDIPMIKAAGVGIAVKNGVEEAKMAADYITENDNEHDAIAEVIEKLILKGNSQ